MPASKQNLPCQRKDVSLLPALLAGLGLMVAGRVTAQNFNAWPVTQVASGANHTVFIKGDGTMWVMGDNSNGQLGLGPTVSNVNVPQQLTNGVGAIAAGGNHSLFVIGRGLWAMGDNEFGQLGDGTTNNQYFPEKVFSVAANFALAPIAAGYYHSLFGTRSLLTSAGGLWAMGYNNRGQLGDNSFTDHHTPEEIVIYSLGSAIVTAISGGSAHTLFTKSDGSLWAMGFNNVGQLGDGSTNGSQAQELNQHFPGTSMLVAAGAGHSIVVAANGSTEATGWNFAGQLAQADGLYQDLHLPAPIKGLPGGLGVTAVAVGFDHSLFILSDGSLWGVGDDEAGQLGQGNFNDWTDTPHQIVASNVVAVAAGGYQSFFIKSDGSLWGIGFNSKGQLGTGDNTDRHTPVLIVSPPPQISIIRSGASFIFTWPTNAVGFNLQSSITLASPSWSNAVPVPVIVNGNFTVTNSISGPQKYYRLSL